MDQLLAVRQASSGMHRFRQKLKREYRQNWQGWAPGPFADVRPLFSRIGIGNGIAIAIGHRIFALLTEPIPDCDSDTDSDESLAGVVLHFGG